jgi:hypothetical protein
VTGERILTPGQVKAAREFAEVADRPIGTPELPACDLSDWTDEELAEAPFGMAHQWPGDAS